jgi:hypothetical protein
MARLLTFRRQIFLNDPYPHDHSHHDKSNNGPDISRLSIFHALIAGYLTKLINKLQLRLSPPLR